jgi:hypothetical protein
MLSPKRSVDDDGEQVVRVVRGCVLVMTMCNVAQVAKISLSDAGERAAATTTLGAHAVALCDSLVRAFVLVRGCGVCDGAMMRSARRCKSRVCSACRATPTTSTRGAGACVCVCVCCRSHDCRARWCMSRAFADACVM